MTRRQDSRRRELVPRFLQRLGRRLTGAAFQTVYHEGYNAAFPEIPNDPLRAERIVAFLASEKLISARTLHRPEPVWLKSLERVHSAAYLDSLRRTETLTSILGIEVTPDQLDRAVDLQRLQTGGTLMATRRARRHGIAVNLGGGFHHAAVDQGGGFCLFNDVAAAIADERRRGFRGRVLVVDLDLHDGDGTRQIFCRDEDVYTFSIHSRHWGPTEAVSSTSLELGTGVEDAAYLEALDGCLPGIFERFRPHLVFYLAGCDPAREDFFGDWKITPRGMLERDQKVLAWARSSPRRPAVVLLLAGGYSTEAWRYTARFLSGIGRKRTIEPPTTDEITFSRYRHITRLLGPEELSGAAASDNFGLTEADLYLPGWGVAKETRFLGYYTRTGIELVLERVGFLDRLRDLGFPHPTLDLRLDDPDGQTMRIFGAPDQRDLLVEMRLRRDRRVLPGFELLALDWLLLQNPRGRFHPTHPPLPGQSHPGLGMLADVGTLLYLACERLHLDGLTFTPAHFHIAAGAHPRAIFLDPGAQQRYEALRDLFRDVATRDAAQAIAAGRVLDTETGEAFRWQPEVMILPASGKLERHLAESTSRASETPPVRYRLAPGSTDLPSLEKQSGP